MSSFSSPPPSDHCLSCSVSPSRFVSLRFRVSEVCGYIQRLFPLLQLFQLFLSTSFSAPDGTRIAQSHLIFRESENKRVHRKRVRVRFSVATIRVGKRQRIRESLSVLFILPKVSAIEKRFRFSFRLHFRSIASVTIANVECKILSQRFIYSTVRIGLGRKFFSFYRYDKVHLCA